LPGAGSALWWLVVVAIMLPIIALLVLQPLYGVAAAVALCLGVLLATRWRQATLVLLALIPFEAYFIPAGSLRLKAFQLVALALVPGFVAALATGRTGLPIPLAPPLLTLVMMSALSVLVSIAPAETIRVVVLEAVLFLTFLVIAAALREQDLLTKALLVLSCAGAVIAVLAVYQVFAVKLGLPTGISRTLGEGRPWKYLSRYGRPSGTFFEPDWFGAFMMQTALLAIPLSVGGPVRYRRLATAASIATIIGLLISGTRAAWLGFAVGLFVLFVVRSSARGRVLKLGVVVAAAVALMLAALAYANHAYFDQIVARVGDMFNSQSSGIEGRLNTLQVVTSQIRLHPWLGSGAGVLDFLVQGTTKAMGGRLGPNVTLTLWMELGVVAFAILAWLLIGLFVRLTRAAVHGGDLAFAAQAALAATVALLVQSQFNNSFLLGYFWAQLGLCSAAIALYEARRREVRRAPELAAFDAAAKELETGGDGAARVLSPARPSGPGP
jgi:hypothetical protein